jgi:hypothetical protein
LIGITGVFPGITLKELSINGLFQVRGRDLIFFLVDDFDRRFEHFKMFIDKYIGRQYNSKISFLIWAH